MKHVLLVGDSIRRGYESRVEELLGPHVKVFAPNENTRFTKYALWGMWDWMERFGVPHIHVAQFNAGIWDLHRCTRDRRRFTEIDDYAKDIRRLGAELQQYSEQVIFANTIPGGKTLDEAAAINALIDTNEAFSKTFLCAPQKEWNADVCAYNRRAETEMVDLGIPVNDMYSAVIADTDRYISSDGIHPTPEGYELLARITVQKIQEYL